MADRYCYACDRPAASDVCDNCGRRASELEHVSPDGSDGAPEYQIGPVPESKANRPRTRWSLVAGLVVVAAVALATLRLPSALEESEPVDIAERVTPTPTTVFVFEPPPRLTWEPSPGTWVGLVTASGAQRLVGTPLPAEPPRGSIDILPDGSYVLHDGDDLQIVGIQGSWDIELGQERSDLVTVSPNGRKLASVDPLGSLRIWDLATKTLVTEVALPSPTEAVMWSPDSDLVGLSFGNGYGVWNVRTGVLSAFGGSGSLVAVSQGGTAVWTEDRLELRGLDGSLQRFWEQLAPSGSPAGAFDPTGRFLAVLATAKVTEDASEATLPPMPGVWMVSIFGTEQVRLGDAGPFAWSGAGEVLYRIEGTSLYSQPIVLGFGPGPVPEAEALSREASVGDRLRIYDPALVPGGTLLLQSAEALRPAVERIAGNALIGILPAVRPDDPQALALSAPIPAFDDIENPGVPILVLEGVGQRAIQLSEGWIFVDSVGVAPYFFTGVSVTSLVGQTLFVDQGTVQAALGPDHHELVLHPADLSEQRVVAVAGVRQTLFVLAATGGRGALYHVAAWSDAIRTPLTDTEGPGSSPLVVLELDSPVDQGRIVTSPDLVTIAVEASSQEGAPRTSIMWVGEGRPPCWPAFNGVCRLAEVQGTAVDFSPDGSWLLVRDPQGQALLVSSRGRGTVALDLEIPIQGAWSSP